MRDRLLVAPSMGCCDLFKLEEQVKFIDARADFLHMDIKDGNYVKTFGIGPDFMAYLKPHVTTPMDAHLMVKHPQDYIEACAEAGAAYKMCIRDSPGTDTDHYDRVPCDGEQAGLRKKLTGYVFGENYGMIIIKYWTFNERKHWRMRGRCFLYLSAKKSEFW